MNNFLLFIAALLVLALSALFAAPYFVDWNDYRDVFEEQASRLIGRTVNVGGDVSLTLLPSPVLRFETVNVADEKGQFDTPFMSARSFTVWLAVPPLLRGAIEAHEVQLEQPVLNLQIGENGSGNWRDIGRADVSLPFVPRSVALDSVKISDARVALARGADEPYLVLDHFDGELSVRSLNGPYKLNGTFRAGGETRQVRFSTGRREENDPVKLKAVVSDVTGRETYSFDGNIDGLNGTPRFNGALHARFAGAGVPGEKTTPADADESTAPVEIKAKVEAGLERARFGDLEIVVRRSNRPQTIRGRLEAAYGDGLAIESELASRWVDLDVMSGDAPSAQGPGAAADVVADIVRRMLGYTALLKKGHLTFGFNQAVLAGDLLTGVKGEVTSEGDAVTLRGLSAVLPGENRITMMGAFTAKENTPSFAGRLELEGKKLNRLLNWTGFKARPIVAAQEGNFSLKTKLTAAAGRVALEEAVGQLFGSHFSGVFRYASGERRQIEMSLESERLDFSAIVGPDAKPLSLPALLRGREKSDAERKSGHPFSWLGKAEARIDLDIGAVTLPGLGSSALVAGLHVVDGDIDIRKLQLKSDRGFDLAANGALTGLAEKPEGNITVAAHADTAEGIEALGGLLELDAILSEDKARLAGLVPMQVTASVRSLDGGKAGLATRMEGNLGQSDMQGRLEIEGSLAKWSEGKINIDVAIRNASGKALLGQLFPKLSQHDLARFNGSSGVFDMAMTGTPKTGMTSSANFNGGGLEWSSRGEIVSTGTGVDFTGQSELKGPGAASLLSLAGVTLAPGRGIDALQLTANIKKIEQTFEITEIKGSVSSATFRGSARVELSDARPRIKLDMTASAASLPVFLEPLVAWGASDEAGSGIVRGVTRTGGFWPDETFDTGLLSALDGEFKLEADELKLAGPLVLGKGRFTAELEDGVLEITSLEGSLYGGSFKANAKISAPGNGLKFEARAEAHQMRLERIAGGAGARPLAYGPIDLELSAKASGLSPRGLAAGLNGDGKLTFGKGEIHHLSPGALKAVAADIGKAGREGAIDDEQLAAAVSRNLAVSGFAFAPFTVPVEVRNGVARIEKANLENPAGQLSVTTFVELPSLKLDSEWMLAAASGQQAEQPRVSLAFAGPLSEIGSIRPVIDTQALKRHATIQRMERDVETLEKLEVPGANKKQQGAKTQDSAEQAKESESQTGEPAESAVTMPPIQDAPPDTASAPEKPGQAPGTGEPAPQSTQPKTAAVPVKPVPSAPPPLPSRAPARPPVVSAPPASPGTPPRQPVVSRPLPPTAPVAPPPSRPPPPQPALPWLVPEQPPRAATAPQAAPPVAPPAAGGQSPSAPIPISPVPNTAAVPDTAAEPPAPAARRRDEFRDLDLLQQDGG